MSEDPFKPQVRLHLEDILPGIWLEGFGDVKVALEDNPALKGATDAFFYEVEAKIKFVIKFGLNDVPKEKEGHRILSMASTSLRGHLVPLIGEDKGIDDLGLNKAILLTPYINSLTLHELVSQKNVSKVWLYNLYLDFLNELKILWKTTYRPGRPRYEDMYLRRLNVRFLSFKDACGFNDKIKVTLVINDKEFELEDKILPYVQEKMTKICSKLKRTCTIHGDEHAKNILVKRSGIGVDTKSWALIDCGNAQKNGDWIFSIAKILHWWKVYFAIENAKKSGDLKGKFLVTSDKIIIKYDKNGFKQKIPKMCDELYNQTLFFCKRVNKEIFKEVDAVWQERLKMAIFINLCRFPRPWAGHF